MPNGQRIECYYDGSDSILGFEAIRDADLEGIGRVISREAIETQKADRAPSSNLTIISDHMVSSLLAHKAIGHVSEGGEIVKRRSFLTGAIGRKVASDIITMYDNGTVRGAHGSVPFNDKGTLSSCTTIIDHSIYTD